MTNKNRCSYLIKEKKLLLDEKTVILGMLQLCWIDLYPKQLESAKNRLEEIDNNLEVVTDLIDKFLCVEDLSPQAIANNRRLLKEVTKEITK